MRERQLVRLFLRFRERKDGHALARVFDAKARELLGVAVHLVRDAQEAEDLVQTTFLAAIERADSFEGTQPLSPWLFGILFKEASKSRRRNARVVEPDRLVERVAEDPLEQAAAREVPAILDEALRRCPGRYREVLEPMLRDGRRAEEIARDLGRSPGTVRMQIHRGLEHLRRLLPAGIGAGVLASFLPTRGLAAVRGEVLRSVGLAPASVIPLSLGILGLVMSKKLLVLPAAVALLTAGWYIASGPEAPMLEPAAQAPTEAPVLDQPSQSGRRERTSIADVAAAPGQVLPDTSSEGGGIAPATVLVLVVDDSARPVPEALILTGWTEVGRTDHDGRLGVLIDRESMEIHARAPGFAPSLVHRLRATGDPDQELVLTLPGPGATLEVTVVDESDQPVADARVTVESRRQNVLLDNGEIAQTPLSRYAMTDANGRTTMGELAPREHPLRVTASGYRTAALQSGILEPGERKELTIKLQRGWAMEGRVVDAAGVPVAGASVAARHADRPYDNTDSVGTTTDEDGRYLLRGIAYYPSFRAVASMGHEGRAEEILEVLPDATLVWNPVLVRGDEVRGRVLDARGEPLVGWSVLLHEPANDTIWHRQTLTGESGHFHIPTTPDWKFHLSVRTPDLWIGTIVERDDVQAGDVDVVIRVPDEALPTASITGRLRYRSGDVPPSPSLRYSKEGDRIAWGAEVDRATGEFQIDPLRPGRYRLSFTPSGLILEELGELLVVGPGQTLELGDVVLEDPGTLVCTLSCPDDPPRGTLEYRLIRLRDGERRGSGGFSGAPPDHLSLLPGHYKLTVNASHYRSARLTFDIHSDTRTPLTINLIPATGLSVNFLAEDGADPLGSIEFVVSVMNTDTVVTRHAVRARSDGRLMLDFDLDPGPYRFNATSDDGRQADQSLWWNSTWTVNSLDLVLK